VPPAANRVALYGVFATPDGSEVVVIERTGGVSVTEALAILVGSAALVAETTTVCGEVMDPGAIYKPLGEIVPTEGLTAQVTAVLVVPDTAAVNCWLCDAIRRVVAGVMEIETADPAVNVTFAPALFVESAALTAVTIIVCWLLTELGAV